MAESYPKTRRVEGLKNNIYKAIKVPVLVDMKSSEQVDFLSERICLDQWLIRKPNGEQCFSIQAWQVELHYVRHMIRCNLIRSLRKLYRKGL